MKQLGVFQLPLDGMLVHCRFSLSNKSAGTHLYTWVERGTIRVKCLAQEHHILPSASARTWTSESGALTIRPLCLPKTYSGTSKLRRAKGLAKYVAITRFHYLKFLLHILQYYSGEEYCLLYQRLWFIKLRLEPLKFQRYTI